MGASEAQTAHVLGAPHGSSATSWPRESLMVTFAFHCNIACTFCMVEDVLNVMPGTTLEQFREAVRDSERLKGVSRIVFSGGEVTLSKQLPNYAAFARSLPGIEHVRIQTNATRLADRNYLKTLVAAGIDEYFVSFHAPDAALYDALVQKEGSFASIMSGIENVVAEGASLTTNTAIVEPNYRRLREIVDRIAPFMPRSMEFWNYWPRADEEAHRQLSARVVDVRPHLLDALAAAIAGGIPPVVKWFPRCLLGSFASYQDDAQPPALIDDEYWSREPAYSCLYEGICADAKTHCSGLSHSYILQHGWEDTALAPRRVEASSSGRNAERIETRSLVKDAGEKRTHTAAVARWLATYQLAPGMVIDGFRLSGAALGRGVAVLALQFERDGDRFEIRFQMRNPSRPAFARTPSYDIVYGRVAPALESAAQRVAMTLARSIEAHDRGGGSLPG